MWRRFNKSRDQTIGSPVLFDTTVDEAYLETIPEVESIASNRNSVVVTGLPELPL